MVRFFSELRAVDHGLADVVSDLHHGLVPMIMTSQMWGQESWCAHKCLNVTVLGEIVDCNS